MQDVLHDVEIEMIKRHLAEGRKGLDHLVSRAIIDEEQLKEFALWQQHITTFAELRDVDKLCRYALTLSSSDFAKHYRFVSWEAAVEFALISLARSKQVSEVRYLIRVNQIYSSNKEGTR